MKRHNVQRSSSTPLPLASAVLLAVAMLLAAAGLAAAVSINGMSGIAGKSIPLNAPTMAKIEKEVEEEEERAITGILASEQQAVPAMGAMSSGACCQGADEPCPADLTDDGVVDSGDLLQLLSAWGSCPDPKDCPADLTGDGVVDSGDLLQLLSAWGSCPDGGECEFVSLEACENLNGFFLGDGTSCDDCPQSAVCPKGAVIDDEPCGDSLNDGCSLNPPGYGQTLTCGDSVCGTLWAQDGARDEDWHRITIAEDTRVSWSIEAPYPVQARIFTDACPPIVVQSTAGQNPTAEACLPAGDYILVVRPDATAGLSCGSELNGYVATVGCEACSAPTGACCTPDGGCAQMAALTCFSTDQDAQYMGNGTTCATVDCPFGPPLGLCEDNCGEIFIPDTMGGFCHCDEQLCLDVPSECCPGACDDCPDLMQCDPTFVCGSATGNCCEPHSGEGCENESCCEAVCSCDAYCCEVEWDVFCATFGECSAAELCPECGGSPCPPVSCTNNEGEPCGSAINDGCAADESNPPFGSITCGQTICGNLWAAASPQFPDGARDTDWFLLNLTDATAPVEVTWSVQANHPVTLFVLTPECPTEVIAGPIDGCDGSITLCLDPGEYILFVAPTVFDGLPCPGVTYEAAVTCNAETCATGQCKGNCGGGFGLPGCYDLGTCECYCDDNCAIFGDCCPGICDDCPDCFGCPGGQGCG